MEVGDNEASGSIDKAGFVDEAGFVVDERSSVVGRALADVEGVVKVIVGRPMVVDSGFDPPQAATTTHRALTSDTTLRSIGKIGRLTTPRNTKGLPSNKLRVCGESWALLIRTHNDALALPKRLGGGRSQRRSGPSKTAKLLLGRP